MHSLLLHASIPSFFILFADHGQEKGRAEAMEAASHAPSG
jgi:hypothetical protein